MKPLIVTRLGCALILTCFGAVCLAQAEKPVNADAKAEQIVQRALQAMGGDRYLQVRTVTGRGLFTDFKDGVSQIPMKFVDYISYPDKERTEFTGGRAKIVQTNFPDGGWVYDGAALTIKDQTAQQLGDFKIAMRAGIENLLHGWWRSQGATVTYAGRREAGIVGRRNEAVRLTYPDGFWVDYEFSADEGMPAKVLYLRKEKNRDTEEMEE